VTPRTSTVEREVKFDVDLDFAIPDLRDLVDTRVLPSEDLWATYFDSDDLRLWRHNVTLRHRRGEDDSRSDHGTWTLKLPHRFAADLLERAELTWPGELPEVPEEVRSIVKGLLRHHPLSPIVELESRRRRLKLQRDGTPLGELDDDRVTVHGGVHDGLRFRQIELELASSDLHLPEAIVQRLRSSGASTGRAGPKLARALGASDQASSHIDLDRTSVLGDVVRRSMQSALSGILEHDVAMRLRDEPPSPHDIHKTRVATRRLRSDLKTLRSLLDPVWTGHLRGDLKWLGAALGELRDIDVLTQYVEDARRSELADNEGAAVLLTRLHAQRTTAGTALATVLDSERYLTLLDKLDAATTRPPFLGRTGGGHHTRGPGGLARKHLPAFTGKAWKKLDASVRKSQRDPTDRSLHHVRIGAKQVRYAAELAEPVIGPPARRTAKAAQRVQELLGTHQDAVVTDRWLRDQIGGGGARADFAAGQLSADQMHRRNRARDRWPKVRRDLRRAKLRRWMG
jgi:CHAD domain-containing protein